MIRSRATFTGANFRPIAVAVVCPNADRRSHGNANPAAVAPRKKSRRSTIIRSSINRYASEPPKIGVQSSGYPPPEEDISPQNTKLSTLACQLCQRHL
jgi:hypothetical protein